MVLVLLGVEQGLIPKTAHRHGAKPPYRRRAHNIHLLLRFENAISRIVTGTFHFCRHLVVIIEDIILTENLGLQND